MIFLYFMQNLQKYMKKMYKRTRDFFLFIYLLDFNFHLKYGFWRGIQKMAPYNIVSFWKERVYVLWFLLLIGVVA